MPDNKTITDPVAEIAERALKKTSVLNLAGWDGSDQRYLFVAPYDCNIDQVQVISDTAVAASDTNYYSFQVQNLTQAEALLASAKTTESTGGAAISADSVYTLDPDQNTVIDDGDVIELQITETGVATDLTGAEILVIVEYT
ncbi:hypothetical protein JYU04_01300 [Dehalococcoides mccartyi]|nr:hypothetical protein [Dehalococcoides mccartyi]